VTDSTLGGIRVVWIRLTFHDGTQGEYRDVEYLRQADGVTLVVGPQELLFVPWHAIRQLQWRLP
jgi:hypothetical protein